MSTYYYQSDNDHNTARVNARLTYFGVLTDYHPEMLESLAKDVYPLWRVNSEASDWYEGVSQPLIKKWRASLRWLPKKPKGKKSVSIDPWLEFATFATLRGWLRSGVDLNELTFQGTYSFYKNPPLRDFDFTVTLKADYKGTGGMATYNPIVEEDKDFKKRVMRLLEERLDELIADTEKGFKDWSKLPIKRKRKRQRDQTKAVGAHMEHHEWVTDNVEHYRWLYLRDVRGEMQAQIARDNSISDASVSEILSALRDLIY